MVLLICSGTQNENWIQVCDITSEMCTSTISFRDEVEVHEQISKGC